MIQHILRNGQITRLYFEKDNDSTNFPYCFSLDPVAARYPDFDGKVFEVELFKGPTGIGKSHNYFQWVLVR